MSTVWEAKSPKMISGRGNEEAVNHPTQKPVSLCKWPIVNHTKEGEIVYEPFGGSGTTLIAAEQLNRRCYAIEIEPKYCDVIIQRWENLTGGKAKKTSA
jgi:DNA modification methylase